ncbi:hypothetical protein GVN21_02555 [Caulobacter sp. SLTY]|uniref:hypothetical protein n=1 Tax=Caulobacter sp. SLTY TaxID=2683262 RepID=UPI001412907D|nr:hypothetical protein [Caulobacter sp. SLTY]NBB14233.1 hypothetical protein [Caulobacter sp. SLTY]
MTDARIAGHGGYLQEESGDLTDLKPVVKEATGQAVRRIGRFISLALIGAARCLGGQTPPPETAVYFTTGSGDFEVTVEVIEHLFRDGFPPKPLSFINTVSNAACFYVAKQFGLSGRSSCLGSKGFGFEAALQLAVLDLKTGVVKSALVGSADIVIPPLDAHRKRLGQPPGAPIAEAAHWLWLTADGEGPAVEAARFFTTRADLLAWIAAQDFDPETTLLAAPVDLAETSLTRRFDYLMGQPYHDSGSARAAGAFLAEAAPGERLVHIASDDEGRYAAFTVRA